MEVIQRITLNGSCMLSTTLHRDAPIQQTRRSRSPWSLPLRVLLGSGDPENRYVIVELLHGVRMEVAITSNSRQTLARASMACSERAWRKHGGADFDLVLIEADIVQEASDFTALLRQTNYSGPILALAADAARLTEFLDAGFDGLLPFPTTNTKDFLQGVQEWSHKIPLLQPLPSPMC